MELKKKFKKKLSQLKAKIFPFIGIKVYLFSTKIGI